MKYLLLLLTLAFSSIAYTCPKLSGAYDCKRFIKGYEIESKVDNNIWSFEINGQKYLADNQRHPLTRPGVTGTYESACVNKSKYQFYQEFVDDETGSIQTEAADFYIKNKSTDTIYVNKVYTFGGEDGFVLRINDICHLEN